MWLLPRCRASSPPLVYTRPCCPRGPPCLPTRLPAFPNPPLPATCPVPHLPSR